MAHGYSSIPLTAMFQLDTSGRTRGHSLKLVKHRCNRDIRKYFFSYRVVSKWNKLNDDTVTAKTANSFKSKLDKECVKKMDSFLASARPCGCRGNSGATILQVSCKMMCSISSVIFVNENENGEKRVNNELVNEN